jgi:PAS domain S-box-containing protein
MEYRLRREDGEYRWILDHGVPRFNADGSFAGYIGSCVDVTESKLAKKALQKSDERLRLAMESGKAVGWDRDVKSGRDSLFGDLQSMFGISSEVYDGRVEDFHGYLHPEDRRWVMEAIEYAMETHKPYAAEFRLRWPDGTVRWLSAKGRFYYSRDGVPERMLGMAIDITDRKLAEEALRESEERYRLAIQAGRMYAFDWDVITDVIVRSEESTRIFGLTAEPIRLTKRELLARVHPEDRAMFINSIVECTPESPNTQISYRLLRPDRSVLWLERTGHGFFDEQGRMVRMIGMVADITERKLAEDKLQEYERAVEGLEEMIAVVDREYRYLIANNTFLKMRNMTKEQVVGRFAHEVLNKGVFETVVKEKLDECFQGKVVRYEMKYTYPELGERNLLVSYFPIEGATGVDRVACIAQDITERKLAEEALSTVSQKLIEAHEEERTRIARELHDDVGQRLVLLAWHVGSSNGELRKQVEDLAKDVQALSHQLHSPKLDYLGLAAAAAGFCRELSDRQRVEIEFHSENIPKELPKEISLCLFRVLQEALQNAMKHSGSQQFQVSLRSGASEIELTVRDSGIGFETDEAIKGPGLGLTSMQERLKLVNGRLSIDSKPQRGTTIQARVPLNPRVKSARAVG